MNCKQGNQTVYYHISQKINQHRPTKINKSEREGTDSSDQVRFRGGFVLDR